MTTTGLNVLSKFKFADALCESPLFGMRSGDNRVGLNIPQSLFLALFAVVSDRRTGAR